jgi:hypothetical protein
MPVPDMPLDEHSDNPVAGLLEHGKHIDNPNVGLKLPGAHGVHDHEFAEALNVPEGHKKHEPDQGVYDPAWHGAHIDKPFVGL